MILYPCVYIKMNTLSRHSEYIGIIILYCIIMTQQISLPIFISPLKHIIYLFFFLNINNITSCTNMLMRIL